jgi:hypothetical protein
MVTRDEVIWAYRLILGREPESEAMIEAQRQYNPDLATLRRGLLQSQEFAASTVAWLESGPNAMQLDLDLLRRCAAPARELTDGSDYCTDWLGVKTDVKLLGIPADRRDVPSAADRNCYEYASLLTAIDRAHEQKRFTMVELGAGWGPWISAAGVVCRRRAFQEVNLIGVEADAGRCRLMQCHLSRNQLLDTPNVNCRVLHGAAWTTDGTVYFPAIDPLKDHGAAVSVTAAERDYRGRPLEHIAVPAYSLSTICDGFETIDYMHWDIQGAEATLASSASEFLDKSVKYLYIGTHNLEIEGQLMKFFYEHHWEVLHYEPWRFRFDRAAPSFDAMGLRDGEIFARNRLLT